MSKITDISPANGKNKRVNIYLDNQFFCSLDNFVVYKYRLKIGQEINSIDLGKITFESEISSGFERAIDLISKTPKTKKQVFDYLKNKGYLPEVCSAIIEKLCEYKYLDDEKYVEIYISTYLNKYGKRKIQYNLIKKGIDLQIIDNALIDVASQSETAENLAAKYLKNKEITRQNLDKLSRYLSGKGFVWEDIKIVIDKFRNGEDYESGY